MDAALSIFEELKGKGLRILDEWVKEGYREDLHLDFKRKAHPHLDFLDENDKRNYSRALSGYANSDGGVIVWGNDAPASGSGLREKKPINQVQNFAEHLDSLASRLVAPPVEGVENYVINEDQANGYVVTYIPQSLKSPHRAEHHSLKKYYQRSGDSFVELEHWQLEYMFGRRQVPDLRVAWDVITLRVDDQRPFSEAVLKLEHGSKKISDAILRICVLNKGRAIARYGCLRIHYRQKHDTFKFNDAYKHTLIHYSNPHPTSFKLGYLEITGRAHPGLVVYPNDRMPFFEFRFTYVKEDLKTQTLPDFTFYYDLFGENIRGETKQKMTISGKTISRILEE